MPTRRSMPSGLRRTSLPTKTSNRLPATKGQGISRFNTSEENELLSKDTIDSLNLFGKFIANTNMTKLKKLTEDELVEKKSQERVQKKTLETLNEMLTLISHNTSLSKSDVLKQVKAQKGSAYNLFQQMNPEDIKKVSELFNDRQGRGQEIENTLLEMKTDSEKKEEERLNVAKEEKENLKEYWSETLEKWDERFMKHEDQLKTSFLGPLSLLVAPIEEFTNGTLFEGIKGFFQRRKEKKAKKNPTEKDLMNNNDIAMLFFWHKTKEFFEKTKEAPAKGLKGLISGLIGGAGMKGLMKNASGIVGKFGIAALVGGLIWSVIDGIASMKMSKEWGTSKLSSFIGGFLGGKEAEKGFKGAFKNAGKWALTGVGTGMLIAGPVGALIGGLVGAAFGGILGYFGGKNIAQGLDKIGGWVKKTISNFWNSGFIQNMIGLIGSTFQNIIDFLYSEGKNIFDLATGKKSLSQFLIDFVGNIFGFINKMITDFLNKTILGQMIQIYLLNPIVNFFNQIGDFFSFLGSLGPMGIANALVSKNFDSRLSSFSEERGKERQYQKMKDVVLDFYDRDKSFLSTYNSLSGDRQKDFINKSFQGLVKSGKIDERVVTSVKDAIITPTGKIIQTDVDDTIVATKNSPTLNPSGGLVEKKLDMMISLLQKILEKDLQVSLPPQTSHDLELLIGDIN